jgi:hypothetical protein
MYQYLINESSPSKFMILLKIKIFFWYLQQGLIPTNDNLTKSNWYGEEMLFL